MAGRVAKNLRVTPEECEDIVSETVLHLLYFERSGKFRHEAKLSTVAYRILENKMADYLRKRYREAAVNVGDVERMFRHRPVPPDMQALVGEAVQLIEKLPDAQRAVFKACISDDLDIPAVAVACGLSERRVSHLYRAARATLAAKLSTRPATGFSPKELEDWARRFHSAFVQAASNAGRLNRMLAGNADKAIEAIVARLKDGDGK